MSSDDGKDTPEGTNPHANDGPDHEEGNEYSALIDHYKKLIEYKNNMFKTDALLAIEKDSYIQEELNKVRASLLTAISYEEDVIKFTQNSDEYYFSPELLTTKCIDRLCRCYFPHENRWHNSKIESVDIENQEAEVTCIGFTDRIKLHGCFIKLIPAPDPINFQVGTQCEAIYSGDGKYYPCTIEKIADGGYHVKFRKYNNKEIVSLYHLKEVVTRDEALPDVSDMKEFKMPDHLKILPNDSEIQRKKKKKKQKALKQSFKNQQIERASTQKQNQWSDFKNKTVQQKKGLQVGRESIFRSPETVEGKVGVTGSGKAMTQFNQRSRYVFEDEAGGQNPNGQPGQPGQDLSKLY